MHLCHTPCPRHRCTALTKPYHETPPPNRVGCRSVPFYSPVSRAAAADTPSPSQSPLHSHRPPPSRWQNPGDYQSPRPEGPSATAKSCPDFHHRGAQRERSGDQMVWDWAAEATLSPRAVDWAQGHRSAEEVRGAGLRCRPVKIEEGQQSSGGSLEAQTELWSLDWLPMDGATRLLRSNGTPCAYLPCGALAKGGAAARTPAAQGSSFSNSWLGSNRGLRGAGVCVDH